MTDIDKALTRATQVLQRELTDPRLLDPAPLSMRIPEQRSHTDAILEQAEEIRELQLAIAVIGKVRSRRSLLSQLELEEPEAWLELRRHYLNQFLIFSKDAVDIGIESPREQHLMEKAYLAGYDRAARTP